MILEVIISILVILVVILGYTTFNLLRKNEKQEDILSSYMQYLSRIDTAIKESDKRIKEIDERGSFKSDDEIGWFFLEIKKIQMILNEFTIKEY
jgi:preprotein translocase subunit YajC